MLIGPNGSGKSNLLEAIALLRSSADDFQAALRKGGGVREWIWKGNPPQTASLDAIIEDPFSDVSLRHFIQFEAFEPGAFIESERIEDAQVHSGEKASGIYYLCRSDAETVSVMGREIPIMQESVNYFISSVLMQRRDPEQYPQFTYLAEQYSRIRIYREWTFGRHTVFREPQRADMRTDRLEEDFSNLGLFLNQMRRKPQAKKAILQHLQDLYEGVDDFDVSVVGGTVQVFFTEGEFTIPATRLSDGTLRYLCLLAILCDPDPPPLICIEEPELGLHPDILPKIADLLVEASGRTQLIVTTHSDILVDAMTERPEVVLVCEKHAGQTQIKRLSAADLSVWLEKYRLGELWTRGELGGTRW